MRPIPWDPIASNRLPSPDAPQRYARVGWNTDDTGAIAEQTRASFRGQYTTQQIPTLLVYPRGMTTSERVELALMLGMNRNSNAD